jgi:mannose-1-phosphate guanylyltransferase
MAIGILLVGGFGTRLKPLTSESPKPMLPVAGLPVTEHQILAAQRAGIHTLVLATSYLSEVFTPYFGDGSQWGMKILYAVEKEPLGTGGAIRNAAQMLDVENLGDEPIVIFNGDVLSRHSISDQIQFHLEKEAVATLHLIEVDDARAFGLRKWITQSPTQLMLAVMFFIHQFSSKSRSVKSSVLSAKLSLPW